MRTLFISDVHLGSRHSQAGKLLKYLDFVKDYYKPDKLYIIGDFIDGWKLKRGWYWNDESTLVIRKILTLVKRGTEVIYIAGNHDEFLREFMNDDHQFELGSIKFVDEAIHETADGRKLLVVHGDKFDISVKYAKWFVKLGDIGYSFLLKLNQLVNRVRDWFSCTSYWSLSKTIKHKVKSAVNFIGHFEEFLTKYAKEKGCDGVVCGHIHTPDARVGANGVWYYNTGDWVESCTSIIEEDDGTIHLQDHLED